ncbi:MAG: hypothetical protein ABIR15_13385 [Chitinophagaceae bacterium]
MTKKIMGTGVAALPENIRQSKIFSDSNMESLASVAGLPVIDPSYDDERLKSIFQYYSISPGEMEKELQLYAKELLDKGQITEAWQVLLTFT